jgi:tetratricopeptide (TPR) repeat protein
MGLLCAVGFLAVFGWHASRVAFPPTFERQVFGIALAEAAEGGNLRRTASAKELTDEVYERLCADLQRQYGREQDADPCATDLPEPDERRVAVQRIGIVADSARAESFGRRINADVVIWGRMLASEQGGITLRFEVLETLDKAINPDFRVIMPVTTTSTELLGVEQDITGGTVEAKEVAAQQAIALSSYILGLVSYLDRDFPEAAKQIEITIATIEESDLLRVPQKGRALIYFYLARAYHALNRVDEGQELLPEAEGANPDEPAFNISLALGYGAIGPPEKLKENLSLALDKLNAWLLENPGDSNALFDRALVHEINRQYQNAAFDYETLIRNDPDFYTAYIQLGLVTFELGRFEEAVDWFEQAIALAEESGANPTSAYVRLGEIYEKAGHVESAREMYQKAAERDPESDKVFHYYAQFLESQQEMDGALAAYRHMAEVSYLQGWAYGELAAFYRRRGLLEEAILSFQRATGADNDNAMLYAYLAETYAENGQPDRAAAAYKDAVAVNEEAGIYYIYDSYAGFLRETGQLAEAVAMYHRSLELRPANYPALMNLGQLYQMMEEPAQAIATYCQILAYDDGFSPEQIRGAEERLANLGHDAGCP